MGESTYVIAGGGVAGASAAESLRGEGFDGRIAVVAVSDADLADDAKPLKSLVPTAEYV